MSRSLLPVAWLSLLLVGCGQASPAVTDVQVMSRGGLVEAHVSFVGEVSRGDNELSVELVALDGASTPELLAVDAMMAAHSHHAHTTAISETAEGFQARNLNLFMSGRWQVELSLAVGAAPDLVSLPVDVP